MWPSRAPSGTLPAAALDDTSAPPSPAATSSRGLAIALGLALLAAWVLALVEGLVLAVGTELGRGPLVGVLVGLWTLVVLASAPLLALGAYRLRHTGAWRDSHPRATGGDAHPRPVGDAALTAALVLFGALALHRLQVALEDRSVETLVLATLLGALAGTLTLLSVRRRLQPRLAHGLHGASPRRVRLVSAALVIPILLVLVASVLDRHGDFLAELGTREPWLDALALALPGGLGLLAAWGAARSTRFAWVSSKLGKPPTRLAWVSLVGLAVLGLVAGILGGRALEAADARALRDRSLYSGTLVRGALRVGVPAPALTTAVGVRACTPGAALAAPGSVGSVDGGAPDILLITIDGLRFDHTSLLPGSAHPNTPRLLEHAARAAVFTRAYAPAPATRSSFRSMFTGLLPGQVAGPPEPRFPWALTLTAEQPTLAAYLRDAGYTTIALVSKPKAFPLSTHALTGFAEVDDVPTAYHTRYSHSAQLKVSRIIGRLAEPPGTSIPPRFVWTHLIEPHYPFTRGPTDAATPPARGHEARHDLAVRYVDEQLDRLLRFALAPERRDRTIVIITSDHGEAFDDHDNSRHGATVYEEELHVPLLVFGPGIVPGPRDTPVSLVELLPTLLALAGLDPATGVCGEGWASALRTGGEPPAGPIYAAALPDNTARYHQLAFLVGHEKLIVDGETGAQQRFDLARDPRERHPDVDSPRVAALRSALEAYLRERGLPTPP